MNFDSLRWCGHCKARGDHHTDRHPCTTCGGHGHVEWDYDDHEAGATVKASAPCPDCGGTGYEQRAPVERRER